MVRVIDPAAAVEDRVGIGGEHGVGLEGADLAHELLAQGEVVGQRPVGTVQERQPGVADDRRRGALLGLAQGGQLERIRVGVLTALVAAGAAHQPAGRALVDPARDGTRRDRSRHRPGGPR